MTKAPPKRKLIEVSLPLEEINKQAAREKSIRHGHPSTLHPWWARRPLAAARAVLFAQLVDDPSAHPDRFPTEDAQDEERKKLHDLIERLVNWDNVGDKTLLDEAHEAILASTEGSPPPILDPFAGGGTIPLEAQRLGLEAHASDLNPVAVLINKALIEIPPKFADQPPIFPGLAESQMAGWSGANGLAADVKAYGEWMRDEAYKRIGKHYPKAKLPDGSEAPVIAWIWARTVTCPSPACGIEMPLVRSWWLGKKKGKEAFVVPTVVADSEHPSGRRIDFEISHDLAKAPEQRRDGTIGRQGATCAACDSTVPLNYIRAQGKENGLGSKLMATVAKGDRHRIYLAPSNSQARAADLAAPDDVPSGDLPTNPRNFNTPGYGLDEWAKLFTNRQLVCLTALADLIEEARGKALSDTPKERGGEAQAYANAIATYLAMAISRTANRMSSLCRWDSSQKVEGVGSVFARQAVPMVWDFAEANPFGTSAGSYLEDVGWITKVIASLPQHNLESASVEVLDARKIRTGSDLISCDPPYYDNINYSDLSDFFYVWLRRSLKEVYPDLFQTLLVPKIEELVANPYRHDGKEGARRFFEEGFYEVFKRARWKAIEGFPITVYYAFKQSDTDEYGEASTGWETLLDGMIRAGWEITATWPLRSEMGNRMLGRGTNALASSIVLALRPRADDAPAIDRRGLLAALQEELPPALKKLEQGNIAPVDLPQAAIGPGMAVFSRYSKVIEADGAEMTVRSALAQVNEILDQVLNEQEGDFDPTTRFAIAWYRQNGFGVGTFGDANNLANARNTSVDEMAKSGVLTSAAGKVGLIPSSDLPEDYDPSLDDSISTWEVLVHMINALEVEGIASAASILDAANKRAEDAIEPELVKELAFLLFSLAEKNSWTEDALGFNKLATSWPDILAAIESGDSTPEVQGELEVDG